MEFMDAIHAIQVGISALFGVIVNDCCANIDTNR